MRFFAYIRKRLRWLFGGLFILILGCLALLWFLAHYRLKQSLRLLVATESKGRFAFEAGDAEISFSQRSLHLRNVRLYTPDTTGIGGVCDIRIPEIFLSLASWKALLADNKLLVDSVAIRVSMISVRASPVNGNSTHRPFQLDDARKALDSTLHRLNVHTFLLQGGELRFDGPDSASYFRAQSIDILVKDFARSAGTDLRLVSSHRFAMVLSGLDWVSSGAIQRLSVGKVSFDTHTQRFEADSVSFQQQSETKEPYLLTADRCYFKSKDISDVLLRKKDFLLDTLVCINPILHQPRSQARPMPPSQSASTKPIYIGIRYVGVVNGQALVQGSNGARSNFSARKANCSIYGLSIDANRKFPIRTDSVRVRLDKLVFTTKDDSYALTIDNLSLEDNDAVFQGVHYGPVREDPEKSTTFTAPLLRLRNIDVQQLLEGHLHASGAELTAPRIVAIQKRKEAASRTSPDSATAKRKMILFYHTLHNLKEIIDAGALDISDGEIHFSRAGEQPIDAVGKGLRAHILLKGILGSEDLDEARRGVDDVRLDELHASFGGHTIRIAGYHIAGNKRYSEEKEVELVLKNGWILSGRQVSWVNFDWDEFQRTGVVRIDSLHIGRCDIRKTGTDLPAESPGSSLAIHPAIKLRLDMSGLQIDTLLFNQTNQKQQIRFAAGGLALKGIRSTDNSIHWDKAAGILRNIQWQNQTTRIVVEQIQLDGKRGITAYGVKGSAEIGQGRLEVTAPEIRLETSILSTTIGPDGLLRVPGATIHFERATGLDSLSLSAELSMTMKMPAFSPLRMYSLDLSVNNSSADFKSRTTNWRVTRLAARLRADTLCLQSGKQPDWRDWLKLTSVDHATVTYNTQAIQTNIQTLSWHPDNSELRLADVNIHPTISRDSFFHRSVWQGDYITGTAAKVLFQRLQFKGDAKKPAIDIASIRLDGVAIQASRDKNIPFHHGVGKAMPTRLMASLPITVNVQQVNISGSQVVYNELSAITGRWGRITLDDLSASIGPLTSRSSTTDTLTLDASARLFDGHIRRFRYRESYFDPNSGFDARASFSPLDLTRVSDISSPAAAVSITGGHVDTAWSIWRGNRYAAYGYMGFRYRDLRIRVLDKKDSAHAGFLPALETFAANILLPGHSRRGSVIYFERDQEKFVFNYWIKTQASGIVSTVLQKKNASYRRLYTEHSQKFFLPPTGLTQGPW